jgi:hypothetical protein
MTKSLIVNNASTTRVSGVFAGMPGADQNSNTTEANSQAIASETVAFSNLYANILSGGSGTNTVTLRDAGADSALVASRAGAGAFGNTSDEVTLTDGDLWAWAFTDTGSNPAYRITKANVEFATGHGALHGAWIPSGVVCDVASATRVQSINGNMIADFRPTSDEGNIQHLNRSYDEWVGMQVRVLANARTNDSVFSNRINGSAGSGVITFGAGITGLIEDDAINDALSDGDLLSFGLTLLTGVEDLTVAGYVSVFKSGGTKSDAVCGYNSGSPRNRTASSTPHYEAIAGQLHDYAALGHSDAQVRVPVGFDGTASNLRCNAGTNSYTGDATLKLMKNGAAVLTLTIPAGVAGRHENAVDTADFVATDELSYEVDEGTSGTLGLWSIGVTLEDTSGAVEIAGTAAIVLGGISLSASGEEELAGTAEIVLGANEIEGMGAEEFVAAANIALNTILVAANGEEEFVAAAEFINHLIQVDALGEEAFAATGGVVLSAPEISASALLEFLSETAFELGLPEISATSALEFGAQGEVSLEVPAISATALLELIAQGVVELFVLEVDAEGDNAAETTGEAVVALFVPEINAIAELSVDGSGAVSISLIQINALGAVPDDGAEGLRHMLRHRKWSISRGRRHRHY